MPPYSATFDTGFAFKIIMEKVIAAVVFGLIVCSLTLIGNDIHDNVRKTIITDIATELSKDMYSDSLKAKYKDAVKGNIKYIDKALKCTCNK